MPELLSTGRILIDCGVTGTENLSRFKISPDSIDVLLITHSHGDHAEPEKIDSLIKSRTKKTPLKIAASPYIIGYLKKTCAAFDPVVAEAGVRIDLGGGIFATPLPANHPVTPADTPFHYLFETPCGNMLYALDGAWMTHPARRIIGKRQLDMVIWDATMSKSGDWRIFEHNDLDMIALMEKTLRNEKVLNPSTKIILDHIARTLWPENNAESSKLASDRGWTLAFDGDVFTLENKDLKQ